MTAPTAASVPDPTPHPTPHPTRDPARDPARDPTPTAVSPRPRWRTLARGLADLCLPRACAVCRVLMDAEALAPAPFAPRPTGPGRTGPTGVAAAHTPRAWVRTEPAVICGACWSRCEAFPAPSCLRCGHPRQPLPGISTLAPVHHNTPHGGHARPGAAAAVEATDDGFSRCRWCERLPPIVRAVRSVARVDRGSAGAVVHALKYEGWQTVALGMAARMARLPWPEDVLAERTALVPVPLAAARLRERGFNQSHLLANEVGRRWALPVWSTLLERTRHTATQTQLTPSERTTNVAGAFRTSSVHQYALRGAHIVLVDDVITTAATLNAAAETLAASGARLISYLTFGRAPDSGDRSSLVSDLD